MKFGFKFRFFFIAFLLISVSFAQNKDKPVLKIGDDVLTVGEFEKAYQKSNGELKSEDYNFEGYKNFLDVYTGYRLKLIEAKNKGFHKNPELLKEFEDYKKRISQNYYINKYVKEPNLKKIHKMGLKEYRISHILLKVDSTRTADAATKMAELFIDSLNKGTEWNKMVELHSEDSYSNKSNGDLYYFSGLRLPAEIKEAVFSTPVGKIYQTPIKSKFGIHIIKVDEVRKNIEAVNVKHILIKHTDSTGVVDEEKARLLCEELRTRVLNGEDFSTLAKEYSQDPGSGKRGGDLGFVPRRQTVRPFDEAMFNTKPGEISEVFKTRFGYHFLTVVGTREPKPFEEFYKSALNYYEKKMLQKDYKNHIDTLIVHSGFELDEEKIKNLNPKVYELVIEDVIADKQLLDELKSVNFLKKGEVNFNVAQLIKGYERNKNREEKLSPELLTKIISSKLGHISYQNVTANLYKTDKEFNKIMSDYFNGLLIFKLQEGNLINASNISLDEKKEYYNSNIEDYMLPARYLIDKYISPKQVDMLKFLEVVNTSERVDEEVKKFKNIAYSQEKVNANSADKIVRYASKLEKNKFSSLFSLKGGNFCIIRLVDKLGKEAKPFEECESEIAGKLIEKKNKIADKKFIDGLKENYEPEYFYENLKQAFK